MMDDLDLMFNDSPVCPHCRHEEEDAWELNLGSDGDSTEITCGNCEKSYGISVNVSRTYNTHKLEESPNKP